MVLRGRSRIHYSRNDDGQIIAAEQLSAFIRMKIRNSEGSMPEIGKRVWVELILFPFAV
jgi:hypothetical protein